MCKYCDMSIVDPEIASPEYYIHRPFYLLDDHTRKRIKADGNHPIMYLREYRNNIGCHTWSIICEFADDPGRVVETPVIYCPVCGDKLIGRELIEE